LDVQIQAASVNTGSDLKNNTLKGKDFFDVDQDPLITFHSTQVVQTGPETFDVPGTFTIRGVSKPETLHLTRLGQRDRIGRDYRDHGLRSEGLWDDPQHSLPAHRRPGRGACQPQSHAREWASCRL
jgi:polyisoprenoid-binding protein YceI